MRSPFIKKNYFPLSNLASAESKMKFSMWQLGFYGLVHEIHYNEFEKWTKSLNTIRHKINFKKKISNSEER